MALATFSLWRGDLVLGLVALFLMGMQSAFLGPAKYGIVPELVSDKKLSDANGFLQASVMVGILLGTGSAGFLKMGLSEHLWVAGLLFTVIALIGVWVAHGIEPPPAADPKRCLHFNPLTRLRVGLRLASKTAGLLPAIFGHGIFWLVGGLGLFAWNEVGTGFSHISEGLWTAGLASLSISVGLGSLCAGRLSRHRPRPSFVTRGAAAMAVGYCFVYWGPHNPWVVWVGCLASNFFMGFYLIPLKAILQSLPAPTEKGRIQGASQMMDWIFIVGASLVKEGLSGIGLRGMETFPVMAGIMAITALFLRFVRPMARMNLV
jgi:acyl-[acyl-carrier-protein]-phospholipid O-acyltransferase/long-chain-fatty-acid--[acyl-carrier-protein] ligase